MKQDLVQLISDFLLGDKKYTEIKTKLAEKNLGRVHEGDEDRAFYQECDRIDVEVLKNVRKLYDRV